jgi:hypothetical protein
MTKNIFYQNSTSETSCYVKTVRTKPDLCHDIYIKMHINYRTKYNITLNKYFHYNTIKAPHSHLDNEVWD